MNEMMFPQCDHCVCVYMSVCFAVTWRYISQNVCTVITAHDKPKIYQMSCISMYHDTIFVMEVYVYKFVFVWTSPPLRRSRRSECLVCVVRCPDRWAEGRKGISSGSTASDSDELWPEESFQALPERKKEKQRSGELDLQNELQFYLTLNGLQKKDKNIKIKCSSKCILYIKCKIKQVC